MIQYIIAFHPFSYQGFIFVHRDHRYQEIAYFSLKRGNRIKGPTRHSSPQEVSHLVTKSYAPTYWPNSDTVHQRRSSSHFKLKENTEGYQSAVYLNL